MLAVTREHRNLFSDIRDTDSQMSFLVVVVGFFLCEKKKPMAKPKAREHASRLRGGLLEIYCGTQETRRYYFTLQADVSDFAKMPLFCS